MIDYKQKMHQLCRVSGKAAALIAVAAAALALFACAVFPTTSSRPSSSSSSSSSSSEVTEGTAGVAPSGGSGGGDYYLDDGPPPQGEVAMADILNTPNAVPRNEPIIAGRNRPYVVMGKRYTPFKSLQPYSRRGIASWYGRRYHGRQTASGEIYDMYKMTAAHPLLPIPSYAKVTRQATGSSIIVRINDRGPFLQGREIDLSYAAAVKLGIVQAGSAEVLVELLLPSDFDEAAANAGGGTVENAVPTGDAVYIQFGAFADEARAQQFLQELAERLPAAYQRRLSVYRKNASLYAVQVGPYASHAAAVADDQILCQQYGQCGFLSKRY